MAKKTASDKTEKNVNIETVEIIGAGDDALVEISRSRLLSLNLLEMRKIAAHYKKKGRNPTDAELE
ncbi:MAG TPA: hypothetical protein PLS19_11775, partial [bacterium]|nr:hypothetical protein [bacterium]